jgi:hypothetical protein
MVNGDQVVLSSRLNVTAGRTIGPVRQLNTEIQAAEGFAKMDTLGSADPYVVILLDGSPITL